MKIKHTRYTLRTEIAPAAVSTHSVVISCSDLGAAFRIASWS